MKLRYGLTGAEKPGLLDREGRIRDLSGLVTDIGGKTLLPEELGRISAVDPATLPLVAGAPRLGPYVAGVGSSYALG